MYQFFIEVSFGVCFCYECLIVGDTVIANKNFMVEDLVKINESFIEIRETLFSIWSIEHR